MRNPLRKGRFNLFLYVFVNQIAFCDGKDAVLVQKFGIIFLKLVEQGLVARLPLRP